jgi:hypothetical protein
MTNWDLFDLGRTGVVSGFTSKEGETGPSDSSSSPLPVVNRSRLVNIIPYLSAHTMKKLLSMIATTEMQILEDIKRVLFLCSADNVAETKAHTISNRDCRPPRAMLSAPH